MINTNAVVVVNDREGENRGPPFDVLVQEQLSLQETSQHVESVGAEDAPPPPLLVMKEEKRHVEEHPQGYVIKDMNDLVTIDKVWKLDSNLPMSKLNQLKDLCLSFAFFKLLRCQFEGTRLLILAPTILSASFRTCC